MLHFVQCIYAVPEIFKISLGLPHLHKQKWYQMKILPRVHWCSTGCHFPISVRVILKLKKKKKKNIYTQGLFEFISTFGMLDTSLNWNYFQIYLSIGVFGKAVC